MPLRNPKLRDLLVCSTCQGVVDESESGFTCRRCNLSFPVVDGRIVIHKSPGDINPSHLEQPDNPNTWGGWRAANFKFLEESLAGRSGKLLDIGSGQSHFREVLKQFDLVSCDIYAYPNVDVVCDATKSLPLKNESFDFVHLSNVLEHIYRPADFLTILSSKLKKGGSVLAMVPFMVGEHQAPYDFHRYTRYCIERLVTESGLKLVELRTYGDSLQLATQFGWQAAQELSASHNSILISAFKWLLTALTRLSKVIRSSRNLPLINSSLAVTTAHGYMFIARKE